MVVTSIPSVLISVAADSIRDNSLSIDNGYIQVVASEDGSSFGIHTLKGKPSKRYDDDKPLLYDGDDKFATSYATVRIIKDNSSVSDYVYGSSKGVFVSPPSIVQLDGTNRAISSTWKVDGVEITQQIIINYETMKSKFIIH